MKNDVYLSGIHIVVFSLFFEGFFFFKLNSPLKALALDIKEGKAGFAIST